MKAFALLLVLVYTIEAAKVLVVFPFPSRSHGNLGAGIVRHLLNDGHEITYITPIEWKNPPANLRIIDVQNNFNVMPKDAINIQSLMRNEIEMNLVTMLFMSQAISNVTLTNGNVRNLLMDTTQQFDIVIAEYMFSSLYSTLAAVYDCPMVWVSSVDIHWQIRQFADGLSNPAYNPDIMSQVKPPLTFVQRVEELWNRVKIMAVEGTIIKYQSSAIYQSTVVPAITKRGRVAPTYHDCLYNISMILVNSYPPLNEPTDLPLNIKYIGGYHIDAPKALPQDLKKIMDGATNGVIYFSMGSNLKSKDMPEQLKKDLVKMFGDLKQTVIWKFEEELPNLPKNLHIVQWAPQTSILAHPKCVLFITHGGLLSTTETIHFGVPVIGIPVFADQFINAAKFENKGFGKKVDLSDNTAVDLKKAITEVLNTPAYRVKAKELSALFHDRTVPPGVELQHWIRHIIRTKGAPHLKSPALLVPWYERLYLDFIALVLVTLWLIKTGLSKIFKKNDGSKKKVDNKKKKN